MIIMVTKNDRLLKDCVFHRYEPKRVSYQTGQPQRKNILLLEIVTRELTLQYKPHKSLKTVANFLRGYLVMRYQLK